MATPIDHALDACDNSGINGLAELDTEGQAAAILAAVDAKAREKGYPRAPLWAVRALAEAARAYSAALDKIVAARAAEEDGPPRKGLRLV